MAMAVSKAKAFPHWPAAMVMSLGLHVAALVFAVSNVPRKPNDPMIEVDVVPAQVSSPPPPPVPDEVPALRVGGGVIGKRRGFSVSRLLVNRPARLTTAMPNPTEPAPAAAGPEPEPSPGPASAESVIVAKTAPAAAPSGGTGTGSGPVAAAPRLGSPRTVAPAVGNGLLAINPNDVHYQPIIPQPLRKPGASFLSRLKFCVTAEGSVDKVTVVTSSEPALDSAILDKARLYRFHPYFDQGHPIPFCFYREYRLSIQE